MIGIVLVAHAPLASALADCARHALGQLERVAIYDVLADEDPDADAARLSQVIAQADDGSGVLVLTDLVGATPSNVACRASKLARGRGTACEVLAGANVPMLLRVLNYRDLPLAQAGARALAGASQGVLRVD